MDRGVEMPKINQEEYEEIKLLPDYDWNWIAREKTGKILSFTNKPTKTDEVWKDKQTRLWFNHKDSQLFQFIQWEDEEPYEIAELIREYEIKELRIVPSGTVIVDSFDEREEIEVKDIEELKSWFEDDKLYVGEYVKHKINQLDEPEVLSQEWIDERKGYVREYNIGHYIQVEHLQNLLVPKQEELESKIKVLIEAYKQEDGAYSNPENGWISGFVEDLENLVEEEPLYYAKLKDVHPLKKEWLVNLTTPKYYVVNTRGLMFGEFTLDLVGVKTNASAYNLEDWGSYGINDDIVDFVRVEEER